MRLFSTLLLWACGLGPAAAHALHASHTHAVASLEHAVAVLLIGGLVGLAIRQIKRLELAKSGAD